MILFVLFVCFFKPKNQSRDRIIPGTNHVVH